jgi:hypothetical protein
VKRFALLIFAVTTATLAATNTLTQADRYAAQASQWQQRGQDFEQIFTALCATALSNTDQNTTLRIDDQVRAMFGGLLRWSRTGGRPQLQNQYDKALHFIGGGAFEGYLDAGRAAAVTKERLDSQRFDNFFDLDDMAATIMGARWVDIAVGGDAARTRRWLELWATGQYSLAKSLPKLHWGHMALGSKDQPSPEQIHAVDDEITKAMPVPTTPSPTGSPRPSLPP